MWMGKEDQENQSGVVHRRWSEEDKSEEAFLFDVIISVTALHHTDIKKALQEIFRVIKKNGQIALTILKKSKVDLKLFKKFKKIDCGKDWLFVNV